MTADSSSLSKQGSLNRIRKHAGYDRFYPSEACKLESVVICWLQNTSDQGRCAAEEQSAEDTCIHFTYLSVFKKGDIMYKQFTQSSLARCRIKLTLLALFLMAFVASATQARTHSRNLATVVNCVGTHSVTWTPGATNTPQQVTVSENSNWSSCAQVLPVPLLTSASSANQFTAQFSCQSILNPVPATWTINWANGETSTYAFTAEVNAVSNNLVITATGTITAGRYKDATVVATFVLQNIGATLNDLCDSSEGVTSAAGTSTLTITTPL